MPDRGIEDEGKERLEAVYERLVAFCYAAHDRFFLNPASHHVIARYEAIACYTERTEKCRSCTGGCVQRAIAALRSQ
ncbi:MAG: hypothetical protein JWR09_5765 [Mucilaginibacter sp.]|nr:hypothetical protein [Mucilaginibacter sp.]